ncbi:MAG: glutamine synthetase [Synechococcaceae cyanobacterium]|nr:glutamine synthetase [Synechococcaceae cyanobacterium]
MAANALDLDPAARERAAQRARALLPGLQAAGLKRLAISFVNHAGATLVKGVPLPRLEPVARDGVGFSPVSDAWTIDGLPDADHPLAVPDGDLRMLPDLEALRPLERDWAWAPGTRHDRDGLLYAADQRGFLRRQVAALAAEGLTLRMGFELEWVVGIPQGEGAWRPAVAGGPYGADRLLEGLDYASAVSEALDAAGLAWLQIHPEYGAGQFELSLAGGTPLEAADAMVLTRLLIQRVTARFGWRCSFSPLPAPGLVGNGGHLHLSVRQHGRPLLQGGGGPAGLTAEGEALIAGLLENLPALLPLACPLALSYRRLQPGSWSAPFQSWGVENREAALRLVPSADDGADAHLELKVADPAANPYLLVGGVLALLPEALGHPRPLPAPVRGDPSRLPSPPPRLPHSLPEAAAAFAAHGGLRRAMGPLLHDTLQASQRAEARRGEALPLQELVASSLWVPTAPPLIGAGSAPQFT